MKQSRKSKRYDDAVIPGEFEAYEAFHQADLELDGVLEGCLRRDGGGVQLGESLSPVKWCNKSGQRSAAVPDVIFPKSCRC